MNAKLPVIGWLCLMMAGACFGAEIPKTRPIADAADATQRAVLLANNEIASYTSRRFTDKTPIAIFTGQQWVWRGRIGWGKGDLEVVVSLRPDGQLIGTRVTELVSIPFQGF